MVRHDGSERRRPATMRRWPNITRQASMRWLRTGGTDVAQDSDAGGGDRWVVIAEEPDQLSAEIVLQFLRGAAISRTAGRRRRHVVPGSVHDGHPRARPAGVGAGGPRRSRAARRGRDATTRRGALNLAGRVRRGGRRWRLRPDRSQPSPRRHPPRAAPRAPAAGRREAAGGGAARATRPAPRRARSRSALPA